MTLPTKAEARAALVERIDRVGIGGGVGGISELLDTFERACVAEAVGPALEVLCATPGITRWPFQAQMLVQEAIDRLKKARGGT